MKKNKCIFESFRLEGRGGFLENVGEKQGKHPDDELVDCSSVKFHIRGAHLQRELNIFFGLDG